MCRNAVFIITHTPPAPQIRKHKEVNYDYTEKDLKIATFFSFSPFEGNIQTLRNVKHGSNYIYTQNKTLRSVKFFLIGNKFFLIGK